MVDAVGRSSVVERTGHAGDVEFLTGHVIRKRSESLEQRRIAGLCEHIGDAGVKVVGAHGMADGLGHRAERDAVLVMVAAVLLVDQAADLDELLRKCEVARLPGDPIKFDHPHVVRRTDGIAGQVGGDIRAQALDVVGGLARAIEQGRLAGDAVVHARRGDEVPHVVGLEVFTVFELLGLGGGDALALRNDFLRVQIAVFALGFGDNVDDAVHFRIERGLPGDGVDLGEGLQPFQEIAIVERRSGKSPGLQAGRDPVVGPGGALHRIAENIPHVRDHRGPTHFKAFAEQAAVPFHVGQIGHIHPGRGGTRRVDQ